MVGREGGEVGTLYVRNGATTVGSTEYLLACQDVSVCVWMCVCSEICVSKVNN